MVFLFVSVVLLLVFSVLGPLVILYRHGSTIAEDFSRVEPVGENAARASAEVARGSAYPDACFRQFTQVESDEAFARLSRRIGSSLDGVVTHRSGRHGHHRKVLSPKFKSSTPFSASR